MHNFAHLRKTCFLLFLVMQSCVKDVDIDQYQEIVIPPTAALDLVYFTLSAENFLNSSGQVQTAKDEVRLEFLDDDYIQDGLVGANFNFIFYNTFPQAFSVTVKLLATNNSVRYQFPVEVPPGQPGTPTVVNYTELVPASRINDIKRSIKLVVEVEMQPNSEPIEGALRLESKAFYKFEFK
ncbi:hypothetical protein [Salinimicrobium soli]|uniref:hypothetical protein n=1 Tax=Salinimicrobium soli TaxID=1254399 RepID=UPI003AAB2DCB